MKKPPTKVAHNRPNFFFSTYCQAAQTQSKSHFLFHKYARIVPFPTHRWPLDGGILAINDFGNNYRINRKYRVSHAEMVFFVELNQFSRNA